MSDKAEALRLADTLDSVVGGALCNRAAACLRRQHAEIAENESVINVWRGRTQRAEAERDALRADAERYQWLASRAHKETSYDRYGNGAHWSIGFFSDDSRHALDAAINAALKEAK